MRELPKPKRADAELPEGLVNDDLPFVPRMVMTPELSQLVDGLIFEWQHREAFADLLQFGIRPMDRAIFHGEPGNGKTMACHWIARELSIPVYRVKCSQIRSKYINECQRKMDDCLNWLQANNEPAVCLFDEAESIFIDREKATGEGGAEHAAATNIFLQALDRWESPMLLVLATNLYDKLDKALVSRFDLKVEFHGPDNEQAAELIRYWGELLNEAGADDWVPLMLAGVKAGEQYESFRQLHQAITRLARDYVAARVREPA